ncbi:hypothetical protein [Rhodoblastus sp.]|uniref:hypothetical protein n=1 Tax=Rhodoblastus sp. TaxID=1962975 RepID=UPI003F9B5C32
MMGIHRRKMLRTVLVGAAAVAAAGLLTLPETAGAVPVPMGLEHVSKTDSFIEKTVVVVHRRARRRVCWWRRGRRVCAWR